MIRRYDSTRYVKQQTKYSCGPVAILNALKKLGYKRTYDYVKQLKKYCKTDRNGTKDENISKALKRFRSLEFKCVNKINTQKLNKYMNDGYIAIILMSKWWEKEPERHYFTIIEKREFNTSFYRVVNWDPEETALWIKKPKMIKIFKRSLRSEMHPKAWFIRKRKCTEK